MRKKALILLLFLGFILILASSCLTAQPEAQPSQPPPARPSGLPQAAKGIDVETIKFCASGWRTSSYSFAIFADPHVTTNAAKLQEAVSKVNTAYPNVKFVIVLGDLIQGEAATAADYKTQFNNAKTALDGLTVPYIPTIGNHDVWCNLSGGTITLQDGTTTIPVYTDTTYPEAIFDQVFGPVYAGLTTTLPGWTKQGGMPITPNPNNSAFPPTYFQNFAFDWGDFHFVCLDFCARDDFKPIDWSIKINNFTIPFTKCQFGHARIQQEYGNNGTIRWLETHLQNYTGSKKIILLSHHPPVFELKGTGRYQSQSVTWNLNDENTYGFKQTEYGSLVNILNSLFKTRGFNYSWFAGHYHVKSMNWTDRTTTPPAGVKVIASVQSLSWINNPPAGLTLDPTITVNKTHSVTTAGNDNGRITIVNVVPFWQCWAPVPRPPYPY